MLDKNYLQDLEEWRQEADDSLRGAESWLSLLGLFWLDEGENLCGAKDDNTIIFPSETAPDYFASFILRNGQVNLRPNLEAGITVNGYAAKEMILKSDRSGEPSEIRLGSLVIKIVERADRFGLRVWDRKHPSRQDFPGRIWFDPSEEFVLEAEYVAYEPPKIIQIINILGDANDGEIVGAVNFVINKTKYSLDALAGGGGRLFILFKDEISGKDTYGAGRYLSTDAPVNGRLILDFNRAYNPPCAFTRFATCPLPPSQNHLLISITAGELFREYIAD